MIKKIYSVYDPPSYTSKTICHGHNIYKVNEKTIFVPKGFSKTHINPVNFLGLKNKFYIKKILIVDRIKPEIKNACIIGHVNRSGFNFFINVQPAKELPMFPDMSNIYTAINGFKQIIVHTVGPKRFNKKTMLKEFVSESSGLLSPIWHYVGVEVLAIPDFNLQAFIDD